MICLNCKKQIPDNADACPFCGTAVSHKEQLVKEISLRRWQRWIFYGILILVFSGMVGVVVKVYNVNSKILAEMSVAKKTLTEKEEVAAKAKDDLKAAQDEAAKVKQEIEDVKSQLNIKDEALAAKIVELEGMVEQNTKVTSNYEQLSLALKNISEAAVGISNEDLNKISLAIPSADGWPAGTDTDGDGLSDDLEEALGTSATSTDTDGDSFTDKIELSGGFNPLGSGQIAVDKNFSDQQRGRIFKQLWGGGYLWYIGSDGARYFLGKSE